MTSSFEKKNILCSNYFPLLALCCEYLQNGLFYFCKVVEKINCFRVPLASTFKQCTNTCFFFTRFTERRTITKQCIFEFLEDLCKQFKKRKNR